MVCPNIEVISDSTLEYMKSGYVHNLDMLTGDKLIHTSKIVQTKLFDISISGGMNLKRSIEQFFNKQFEIYTS